MASMRIAGWPLPLQPAHQHGGHYGKHLLEDGRAQPAHHGGLIGNRAAQILGAEQPAQNVIALHPDIVPAHRIGILVELLHVALAHVAPELLHLFHRGCIAPHGLVEGRHQRAHCLLRLLLVQAELLREVLDRLAILGLLQHFEHVHHRKHSNSWRGAGFARRHRTRGLWLQLVQSVARKRSPNQAGTFTNPL
jgi:hypothetical protein